MSSLQRSAQGPCRTALITIILSALGACGGGGSSSPTVPGPPPVGSPPAAVLPAVLSGSASASAITQLTNSRAARVGGSDVSRGFLLTRLVALLEPTATVDQVNAAARVIGATSIVTSTVGEPLITLEIPRQTGIGALKALARQFAAQPGIAFAFAGSEFGISVLPEQSPGVPVSALDLRHLLPARFPQAWNARHAIGESCLSRSVPVIVWDKFGPLANRPDFLGQIDANNFVFDVAAAPGESSGHGYDVSLVIAADFDADRPTGAHPFGNCVRLHQVEASGFDFNTAIALLTTVLQGQGRLVLNNSMNFIEPLCGANADEACTFENVAVTDVDDIRGAIVERIVAAYWLGVRLQEVNSDDRMLFVVSAGNLSDAGDSFFARHYPGFRDSRFANVFALATHLSTIDASLQDIALWRSDEPEFPDATFDQSMMDELLLSLPLPPDVGADTVLIVDSARSGDSPADVLPSTFNFDNARVRAVGEGVSLQGTADVTGTSFAAPQVAGLAAYLWTLSDTLRAEPPAATANLIVRTATPNDIGTPLMDAYAAALALDRPGGEPAVRRALLDVNDDGVFDHLDLLLFAAAYQLADPDAPTIPAARDFSRFDMNGDGFTGGILIAAFDLDVAGLDANGLPSIEVVEAGVENYEIAFNEAALSDLQVLCYYAYAGDGGNSTLPRFYDARAEAISARTDILGPEHCVRARLEIQIPQTIETDAPLEVTVSVPNGADFVPAADLLVSLTASCGAVNPASGRSDPQGRFDSTVSIASGCAAVSVEVITRVNESEPVLAQTTVSAQAASQGTFTIGETGGHIQVGATAIGSSEVNQFSDDKEATGVPFSLAGTSQGTATGASASTTISGNADISHSTTSLSFRIAGRLQAEATADADPLTRASAGGTILAWIDIEIAGGPFRYSLRAESSGTLRNGGCDPFINGERIGSGGTLEPGDMRIQISCGGAVGTLDGAQSMDATISYEFQMFR